MPITSPQPGPGDWIQWRRGGDWFPALVLGVNDDGSLCVQAHKVVRRNNSGIYLNVHNHVHHVDDDASAAHRRQNGEWRLSPLMQAVFEHSLESLEVSA